MCRVFFTQYRSGFRRTITVIRVNLTDARHDGLSTKVCDSQVSTSQSHLSLPHPPEKEELKEEAPLRLSQTRHFRLSPIGHFCLATTRR
ncbi:hypothetical protein NHX12_001282 [Muraenolepis orangiensis]|uniref:Uncharacterized protein n=1 Tax=Muraenolepis orangiensis TaxID=630683 RepID=A0A9Q0DZE3_9TELE|nr:hypothetical protein NHX12_001282 [Muraenolepis orangiensis]